jgi:hypothetical protein
VTRTAGATRGGTAVSDDRAVTSRAARRRIRRRRIGIALLAFGLSGVGLVLIAAVLLVGSLSALRDAATGFERQRAEVIAMLGPASDALSKAATSASNAGTSLTQTSAAADRAASLTSRLADSFDGLAALGSFEVFGTRPFGDVAGQFSAVGGEARALSTDLTSSASAMRTNVADSAAVAADLRTLSTQLSQLEASLGAGDGASAAAGSASLPIEALFLVLLGLLAWFAVPAVVSAWLGWRLVRGRRWGSPDVDG